MALTPPPPEDGNPAYHITQRDLRTLRDTLDSDVYAVIRRLVGRDDPFNKDLDGPSREWVSRRLQRAADRSRTEG